MPHVKHVIRLSNVSHSFALGRDRLEVLYDVSATIYPQEFTIIYGPSGSGKSTLLNTILGLEKPKVGNVYVNGQNITKLDDDQRAEVRNKKFGVIYQQAFWIKSLNVQENVALPLLISGKSIKYAETWAMNALSEVGMEGVANRLPTQLSGGQQQRVNTARALVANPNLIVADEPTGNLDSTSADQVIDLFNYLVKNFKRTIVMVTHELRFLKFADRAIAVRDGKVEGEYGREEIRKITDELVKDLEAGLAK